MRLRSMRLRSMRLRSMRNLVNGSATSLEKNTRPMRADILANAYRT